MPRLLPFLFTPDDSDRKFSKDEILLSVLSRPRTESTAGAWNDQLVAPDMETEALFCELWVRIWSSDWVLLRTVNFVHISRMREELEEGGCNATETMSSVEYHTTDPVALTGVEVSSRKYSSPSPEIET